MDWIELNGVSLRYDLSGNGKETVILIHELGGGIESFDEVMPAFRQEFRILRWDQRGFGLSEKTHMITIEIILADLIGLLDALRINGACHVAGTAMGAIIAIAYAARHPQRVKRLAVASPAIGVTDAVIAQREERDAAIRQGGMRAAVETSLARSYPKALRGNAARFTRYRNRWIACDPEGYMAGNAMTTKLDPSGDFAKITAPTLVIGCAHDPIRPPTGSKKAAEAIKGARYIEVESGHFMAVETPELFVKHVVPFFKGA